MSRIEDEVCKRIQQRAEVGKRKYGVTMETANLSHLEWLVHAQEEAMDLCVYLQKCIEIERERLELKSIRRDYVEAKLREMEE
tara:strand:- start:7115 stop:7363 length:249 start_codon:yes stop_codon:yes gene_type:complete